MTSWILGLTIGFLGSWHCLGMCGPLAMALPYRDSGMWARGIKSLLYSSGRTISYVALGLVFGLISEHFLIVEWQRTLSIVLGVIVLFFLFFPYFYHKFTLSVDNTFFVARVKRGVVQQFKRRGLLSFLVAGMLNGWIPCAMVYMAAVIALGSNSTLDAVYIMLGFGMGTWPAMIFLSLLRSLVRVPQFSFKVLSAPLMVVFGVLMIWRGIVAEMPNIEPMGPLNPASLTICK